MTEGFYTTPEGERVPAPGVLGEMAERLLRNAGLVLAYRRGSVELHFGTGPVEMLVHGRVVNVVKAGTKG